MEAILTPRRAGISCKVVQNRMSKDPSSVGTGGAEGAEGAGGSASTAGVDDFPSLSHARDRGRLFGSIRGGRTISS